MQILLAEMQEVVGTVDRLVKDVQTVDESLKESARAVQEAARLVKNAMASLPPAHPSPAVPTIAPRPPSARAAIVAGTLGGLVAGCIVAGAAVWMSQDRDDARVGRAVKAAFATLDPLTQQKLQTAINKAAQ